MGRVEAGELWLIVSKGEGVCEREREEEEKVEEKEKEENMVRLG